MVKHITHEYAIYTTSVVDKHDKEKFLNSFPNKTWFLAPLAEGQQAIVMALCPSCVRLSVRPCVRP